MEVDKLGPRPVPKIDDQGSSQFEAKDSQQETSWQSAVEENSSSTGDQIGGSDGDSGVITQAYGLGEDGGGDVGASTLATGEEDSGDTGVITQAYGLGEDGGGDISPPPPGIGERDIDSLVIGTEGGDSGSWTPKISERDGGPDIDGLVIGNEDDDTGVVTTAYGLGEDGGGDIGATTLATGEEDGGADTGVVTTAFGRGEDGGGDIGATTLATGEEDGGGAD